MQYVKPKYEGMQHKRLISDIQPRARRHPRSRHISNHTQRRRYDTPAPRREVASPIAKSKPQEKPSPQAQTPQEKQTEHKPDDTPKLTVSEHIEEFRKRLIVSLLALFVGGALGYVYRDQVFDVLIRPLNRELYYTNPAGGFEFLVKVCLFVGFLAAIPILVYQLMKFLAPALPKNITYKTSKVMLASVSLAVAGACFAYFVSLPAALHFLNNFSSGPINELITANEYFNFVMIYVVGFAALFQMPLILFFINKITPLSPKTLMSKQRFVILGSFIVAAILTPTPDPFNQVLMAAPMIMLYQSSIGVVWTSNRRNKGHKKQHFETALA